MATSNDSQTPSVDSSNPILFVDEFSRSSELSTGAGAEAIRKVAEAGAHLADLKVKGVWVR